MDASYLDAVERGDMETAQKMVMEAAKIAMPNTKVVDENGNPKVVYHQTNHSVYINRETGQNWDELDWRERMEWDKRDDWDDYWEEREFNTFSRVNARTTQELDGFFFAPEYDEYHEYGDRTIEETFGGIWIEDTEEFAKFVTAVTNSPFEEDGEGIAYTDNYFYAYYRNINGEPVPYASVYMNEYESQDVVNQVNKELGNVRKGERTKFYFDRVAIRVGALQSENNANNGSNQNAPRSVGNSGVVQGLLRKGRYYDNPSLYVKTSRTDGRGDVNYSLSDIPFFDAEGNAIDMSAISEAKALEMIDGRVRDMMAYDYNKSVIDIAKRANENRKTTRAYYAEERRKRRGTPPLTLKPYKITYQTN